MVRDWNSLPDDHRNAPTVDSFNCHLNHNKKVVRRHFCIGHRKLQVLHTRLGTKYSALNYDLFIKNIYQNGNQITIKYMVRCFFRRHTFIPRKERSFRCIAIPDYVT